VRGNVYPLVHLASYLDVTPGSIDERSPVLLFSSGRQRMALVLDAIPGRQEVVVKNLGPHLRDVRGVTGATVLGDGRVVLILNLPELLSVPPRAGAVMPAIPVPSSTSPRMPTAPAPNTAGPVLDAAAIARLNTGDLNPVNTPVREPNLPRTAPLPAPERSPAAWTTTPQPAFRATDGQRVTERPTEGPARRSGFILVVDDSPSVRRVVGNMLKANGWEVQTARDGIEALESVGRQMPAAVLLDIEMPRMDGYELLATLRSQPQYKNLPLVVLTSRAAAKHHQRAIQLGANAYVVKPYQDEELLQTLDRLVAAVRSHS
jgi:CheY-like chemotaxis protein